MTISRRRFLAGTTFGLAFGPAAAGGPLADPPAGEDWPCFLGPRQDGTSRETGLLEMWSESGPPRLWAHAVGNAYSAPVVARGKLVAFHRIGAEEIVECLEAASGKPVWRHGYPTSYEDRYGYNNGPRSSPAIDGDRVYTYGAEGVLTCLDFAAGRRIWQCRANAEYGVSQGFFGAGTAPVVEGALVLVNIGGAGAGVVAFDKLTGKTVWKASSDGASYSTPVVRTIGTKRLAIFFTADGLLVLDPESGSVVHRLPFRSRTYESVNAASPVVVDNIIFLSATYNTGAIALAVEPGGLKTLWQSRDAMQNHWATSIHHNGYLYGMDGRHEYGSNFRCIELRTGHVRWTADEGLGRASFLMAASHLIALGERGDLARIEVSPERYIEKARVRALEYPCWTPPVLSHGLLYLRNENRLVCLDLRGKRK